MFLDFFSLLFITTLRVFFCSDPLSSPCLNIPTNQCYLCPFNYSLNPDSLKMKQYPSNFSECTLKIQSKYYQNILVQNYTNNEAKYSNSFTRIYEDFSSAVIQEYLFSDNFLYGEINFFLFGNEFFFEETHLLYQNMELFRRINIKINFFPLNCDFMNISGCFDEGSSNKPIIHFQTNRFYFFIAYQLLFENIIFDWMMGNSTNFLPARIGFFILEQILDDSNSVIPYLQISKCDFTNSAFLIGTFTSFFTFFTSSNINLILVNFTNFLISSVVFNEYQINYQVILSEFYPVLKLSLFLTLSAVKFRDSGQNSPKIIYADDFYVNLTVKYCAFINIYAPNLSIFSFLTLSNIIFIDCLFANITLNTLFELSYCQFSLTNAIFQQVSLEESLVLTSLTIYPTNINISFCAFYQTQANSIMFEFINTVCFINSLFIQSSSNYAFDIHYSNLSIQNFFITVDKKNIIIFFQSSFSFIQLLKGFVKNNPGFQIQEYFIQTKSSFWNIELMFFSYIEAPSIFFLDYDHFILSNSIFWDLSQVNNIFERDINYYQILLNQCYFFNSSINTLIDSVRSNTNNLPISFTINQSILKSIIILGNYILRVCCCDVNLTSSQFNDVLIKHESSVIFLMYFDYKSNILIKDSLFLNSGFTMEPVVSVYGFDYCLLFSLNTQKLTLINTTFQINERISLKSGFLVSIALSTTKIIINHCFFLRNKISDEFHTAGIWISYAKSIELKNNVFANLTSPSINSFMHQNGVVSLTTSDGYAFTYVNKTVILKNCSFFNCSSNIGGAITIINYHKLLIGWCFFYNSSATIGSHLAIIGSTIVVFYGNLLLLSVGEQGSAIYLDQILNFFLKNSKIAKSKTSLYGSLYLKSGSFAILTDFKFYSCLSLFDAGDIYSDSGTVIIKNGQFLFSQSQNNGGSLILKDGMIIFLKNLIFNNSMAGSGGTLFLDKIHIVILRNIQINNSTSETTGGAIYFSNIENIIILDILVQNSQAKSIGVLYFDNLVKTSKWFIKSLYCLGNIALKGSCIFYFSLSNLTIIHSLMSNNSGSILYFPFNLFLMVSLVEVVIKDNISDDELIYGSDMTLFIRKAVLLENSPKQFFLNLYSSNIYFIEIKFMNNTNEKLYISTSILQFQASDVFLANLTIKNFEILSFIYGQGGTLIFLDSNFENVGVMTLLEISEINLMMNNSFFLNIKGNVIHLDNSGIFLQKCRFSKKEIINFSYAEIEIIQKAKDTLISKKLLISSCLFENASTVIFFALIDSEYDFFFLKNVQIIGRNSNFSCGLVISNCLKILLDTVVFDKLVADNGAAFSFKNSLNAIPVILIKNSAFMNSCAGRGTGIFITSLCRIQILNTKWLNNIALGDPSNSDMGIGAAIYLDSMSPIFMTALAFINNSLFYNNYASKYGCTIISNRYFYHFDEFIQLFNNSDGMNVSNTFILYPKTLLMNFSGLDFEKNTTVTIISGIPFNLAIEIRDSHQQNIIYDDISQSVFLPESNFSQIFLENQVSKAQSGVFLFNNMMIKALSNETVTLRLEVKFDYSLSDYSENMVTFHQDFKFYVKPCMKGEIITQDYSCTKCLIGFYSLISPMETDQKITQKCITCPENALCTGGWYIFPNSGFWRIDENSTKIIKCIIPDSCLGHPNDDNFYLNESKITLEQLKGPCMIGHEGNLCYDCALGYGRLLKLMACRACDELKTIVLISFVSIVIIMFLYILIMSVIFLKNNGKIFKSQSNYFLIILKILLNHLQELTLMTSISIDWPIKSFDFINEYKEYLAFIEPGFFMNSCVVEWLVVIKSRSDIFKLKKIILAIFPIIMTFFVMMTFVLHVFLCGSCSKNRELKGKYRSKVKISFITSYFIFYPLVIKNAFDLMNCIALDDNEEILGLYFYPDIICWGNDHIDLFYKVALPSIAFWAIIMPIAIIYRLKLKKLFKFFFLKHSKHYRDTKIKKFLIANKFDDQLPNITKKASEGDKSQANLLMLSQGGLKFLRPPPKLPKNPVRHNKFHVRFSENVVNHERKPRRRYRIKRGKSTNNLEIAEKKSPLRTTSSFLFFSTGYKIEFIYWEFIHFTRKFYLIALINSNQLIHYSTVSILVLIIVFLHFALQLKFSPYETKLMNKLQIVSILANLFTIFGINFLTGQYYGIFRSIIAVLIISCHFLFLVFCVITLIRQRKENLRLK